MKKNEKDRTVEIDSIGEDFIQEAILKDGEKLEQILGEPAYKNSDDKTVEAEIQSILHDRETVHKKKKTIRSGSMLAKAAMLILVAGIGVIGVSLTSEATRMWWMDSLGWEIVNDNATQVDNDEIRDVSGVEEWEAAAEIEATLGIKVPKFMYLPSSCEFSDFSYETIMNRALMNYKIDDIYIKLNMVIGTNNHTQSVNYDGSVVQEEILETVFMDVKLKEINVDKNKNYVIAEWYYEDTHYYLEGKISYNDMKKIVGNMIL